MRTRFAARAAGLVVALAAAVAFCALGAWQWSRGAWKERQTEAWAQAQAAPARPLAAALEAGTTPVRVVGAGRFDAGATVLLDNQVRDGRAGAMVFSLFRPAHSARAVLVNRGWIALDTARAPAAPIDEVAGEVEIAGLLQTPPAIGLRMGSERYERRVPPPLLARLDMAALRTQMDATLADAVVLLDPAAPFGYARDWRPLPNAMPPERHRAYAVQWFALALAALIVWAVLAFRKS